MRVFLILAKDCPACQMFKNSRTYNEIIQMISRETDGNFNEIVVKSVRVSREESEVTKLLGNKASSLIQWYPSFIMNINGEYRRFGEVVGHTIQPSPTLDNILKWIKDAKGNESHGKKRSSVDYINFKSMGFNTRKEVITVFFITAKDCKGCDILEKNGTLGEIMKMFYLESDIFKKIVVNSVKIFPPQEVLNQVSKEAANLVRWYPCYIAKVNGRYIRFGSIVDNKISPSPNRDNLLMWIRSLKTDMNKMILYANTTRDVFRG